MWNVGTTSHTTSVKVNYGTIQNWVGLSEIRGGRIQGRVQMWNPLGGLYVNFVTGGSEEYRFQKSQEESMEGLGSGFVNKQ